MELTSVKVIKDIAAKFDFGFSKGLGQNFLTDPQVLDKIVEAAEIEHGVIEIGPGFGVLTKELAKNADKVVTIEIDKRLIDVLGYTLKGFDNVKIINDDVLKINLRSIIDEEFNNEKVSVAANLPYYITTPIIAMLIESKLPIKNIVVMVQKEVADRMGASPGTKDYGAISVMCQYHTNVSIITNVPASSFVPSPKVDSAVIKFEICDKPNVCVNDEKMFFRVVKASFAQRRKTLLNCLTSVMGVEKTIISDLLESVDIKPNVRGETLGLVEFAKIADAFTAYLKQ